MQKIIKTISLLFSFLTIVSCSESDNDISQVTFLPSITVNGERSIQLDCSDSFTYEDEGGFATENGIEVELITETSGTYFGSSVIDIPDLYTITYSATNVDGIPGAETREVTAFPCNGDFVTSIAGVYSADVDRNSGGEVYEELSPILIIDLGDGVFQISDAIGGFYEFGRGFGSQYPATGMTITANDVSTGDFNVSTDIVEVGLFGGALSMTAISVDPVNKTISFTTDWDAGFIFDVVLTQI